MVTERIAPTVTRSHGSDTIAKGNAARTRPADSTAAADATAAAAATANVEALLQQQVLEQTRQPHSAPKTAGIERQSQQQRLNMTGFDNIETLSTGKDQWQNLSWKITTAVSGMNGDLAELLNAAETGGVSKVEGILIDEEIVDANADKCMKASKEMCSVFARYTNSESSTIVRSVTGLDGVRRLDKPPRKSQQENTGKNIQSAT